MANFPANRIVIQADAIEWLKHVPAPVGASVITSLPDYSELSGLNFNEWKKWFVASAQTIIRWLPMDGVAVFYQSDIRHEDVWIDKGFLITLAAENESSPILWHKIVCRKPPGTIAPGRPSYSHMICISRQTRPASQRPGPDVIADAGHMSWPRAMGENACRVACRFLRDEVKATLVVDPFCGQGAALAMANNLGLSALGVDLSAKRCRIALAATCERGGDAF